MSREVTDRKISFAVLAALTTLGLAPSAFADLRVSPQAVILDGPEATQQLLVSTINPKNDPVDLTRRVRYELANPSIARINDSGLIEPLAEGSTEIRIHHEGKQTRVPVEVKNFKNPIPVSFEQQIIPLLTKAGCNSGGCHGKAEGQNGLS